MLLVFFNYCCCCFFISNWHNPEEVFWDRHYKAIIIQATLTQTCTHIFPSQGKAQSPKGICSLSSLHNIFQGLMNEHFPDWNEQEGQFQSSSSRASTIAMTTIMPWKAFFKCWGIQEALPVHFYFVSLAKWSEVFTVFIYCFLLGCSSAFSGKMIPQSYKSWTWEIV